MIIVLKHVKVGDLSYVSHKDTMNVMHRGLKRAKIDVNYSQGFNKHMLTYATTPIPLGTQSISEYYAVDCNNVTAEKFLQLYNDNMPEGLRGLSAVEKVKNPNLAANVIASDYMVKCSNIIPVEIEDIKDQKEYIIKVSKKGELVEKDVRDLIFDLYVDGKNLWIRGATGNSNLRIDSFVKHLMKEYNIKTTVNDITRLSQFVKTETGFINVEDYLK